MIPIESYKAAIGKWHLFCLIRPLIDSASGLLLMFLFYYIVISGGSSREKERKNYVCFRLALLLTMLLVICGSVDVNPGPDKELRICTVNMRSLKPNDRSIKLDEMYSTLGIDKNFDIIGVTETWLDNNVDDELINLPNYQVFRRDRDRHGGGVAIYVSHSIPVKHLHDFNIRDIEIVCVELKLAKKRIVIACIYRPPGNRTDANTLIEHFQFVINMMIDKDPESIIILGDFNDRCLNWHDSHSQSELGTKLRDCVSGNLLFQIIEEPTHYAPNSNSLLDLIITDSPGYILDSGVGVPIGDPYHCYVFCRLSIKYNTDKKYERTFWKYSEANFLDLNEDLNTAPWDTMFIFDDINDMTNYFTELFLDACRKHIPQKSVTINPKDKAWMTNEIKHKLHVRDKYHRRWKRSGSQFDLDLYRLKRNEANIAMMTAKSTHFERLKEKLCDPTVSNKEYWHLIKLLYGNKVETSIPSIIDNNNEYSTATAKAELFNSHFLEKSRLSSNAQTLPILPDITENCLNRIIITEEKVKKVLLSLNTKKATGCDSISNHILKHCASSISLPLSKLFQKSLNQGKFPDSWKKANVTPVFKKGDKQNKNNYRPISILPNIGKVFERVVYQEVYSFFKIHNLLTWRNSGYKSSDSSINQLIYISHKIYESLEKGDDVCLVSLDATAAFDRVWHEGLLYKLKRKHISGQLHEWFKSYLNNRIQRVVIKGQASSWEFVTSGVPQGSILGPLLFLVYIDDIIKDIETNILLYADDTLLLHPINEPNSFHALNNDLKTLDLWSKLWLVNFNPIKTSYIIFSKKLLKSNHPDLYLGNVKLIEQSKHKQLGVLFNNKITFEDHIDQQCDKALKRLTTLKRLQCKIPRQSRLQIYLSFIRPILEFGWELYDSSSKVHLSKLESIQREALLTVTRGYKCTSHSALLAETGVQLLATRRKLRKNLFMYKHSTNSLPSYLSNEIPSTVGSRCEYTLRNRNNIDAFKTKKNYLLKSFIPSSIKSWNELDNDVRNSSSYNTFKEKLFKLYGNSSYSLYLYGDSNGAVNLSRIRMGLSGLNSQRRRVRFIESSECGYCGSRNETPSHFFLECTAFAAPREDLLRSLRSIDDLIVPSDNELKTRKYKDHLTNTLTFGTKCEQIDSLMFSHVHHFITQTKRFL